MKVRQRIFLWIKLKLIHVIETCLKFQLKLWLCITFPTSNGGKIVLPLKFLGTKIPPLSTLAYNLCTHKF